MNDRDQRRLERAQRVQAFGTENASAFAPGGKAQTHFTNIGSLILRLEKARAGQAPHRVSKSTLLDALMLDLQNIARTAKQIAQAEHGFAAPYRIPDNTSEASILAHTDGVLGELEDQPDDGAELRAAKAARRERFVAYELPADFVAQLRADRDAIAQTTRENQGEVLDGVENTSLIGELLGEINREVAEIDAIVRNKFTRQPEKLRAWASASRVERAPQREKPAAAAPAAGAAPATPSA